MSANLLYEPGSVRGDCGVLYITANQPCTIPFYFQIKQTNPQGEQVDYTILSDEIVRFEIKSDIKLITKIITKSYTGIQNNVAVLRLTEDDMKNLLGGKVYIMSVKLFSGAGVLLKTLIKQIQIKVQEVV